MVMKKKMKLSSKVKHMRNLKKQLVILQCVSLPEQLMNTEEGYDIKEKIIGLLQKIKSRYQKNSMKKIM